jgi:hypothetical protein
MEKVPAAIAEMREAMCHADTSASGETVSPSALQTEPDRDAMPDRGLPRHFSIHFCADKNGYTQVYSDDIPEFYISGNMDYHVASDIEPVLSRILRDNYGTTIAGFCQNQIEEPARATRTAHPDGSQHDTNKLDEAKEIIRLFSGIPIPEEIDTGWDCVNVTLLNCNIRRARSFLKENGNAP